MSDSAAQPRGLLFNSSIYVLGQVASRALSFVLLIIYARFLIPDDFAITGTLAAYGQVLAAVFVLGLHGAVSRHYFDLRKEPARLASYLSSVYAFQLVFSGVLAIAIELWGPALWLRFTSGQIEFGYVRLALWATLLAAITQIPQSLYQTEERAAALVGLQLAQAVVAVVAGILFVAILEQRALGMLRSQVAAAAVLAAVFGIAFVRRWRSLDLRWEHVRDALKFGLPLLPHTLGTILMQTVDRIMLEKYAPQTEVGLYSIAMMLSMVLAMVAGAVNQAWAPRFLRTSIDEPAAARASAERFAALFLALFAALSLVGALLGHELSLILGRAYQPAVPFLIPLVIGNLIGIYYFLPANQLMLSSRTTWFIVATGLATLVSVGLNMWLLPRGGGGIASAWIFVAGSLLQAGIIYVAARAYERPLIRLPHFVVLALATAAMAVATRQPSLPIRAAMLAGTCAAIYVLLVMPTLRRRA